MYRYVCPNCLRTFVQEKKEDGLFCWKCGQELVRVPNNNREQEKDGMDKR